MAVMLPLPMGTPRRIRTGTEMGIVAALDSDTDAMLKAVLFIGPDLWDQAVMSWLTAIVAATDEVALAEGGPGAQLAERTIAAVRAGDREALDACLDEDHPDEVVFEKMAVLLRLLHELAEEVAV